MSRKPGIGSNYLKTHTKYHIQGMYNFAKINGSTTRLPRFYKDRIFDEDQRFMLATESLYAQTNSFYDEIQRLSKIHDDPYSHYAERVMNQHDSVTNKINELNKF